MNDNLKQIIEDYKMRVKQGESITSVIGDLHADGLHIINAIIVLREVYSLSLKEAKNLVSEHPAWAEIVEQSKPVQSIFADVFASSSL